MSPVSRWSNSTAGPCRRRQLVSVSPAYVSASRTARASRCHFVGLWLQELSAGPGLLLSWISGGNVYTFSLPRVEAEWSSLFCFTVLLEPTDSRVAFVILRNDPPTHFLSCCL